MNSLKRVLVAGGHGLVGSSFIEEVRERDNYSDGYITKLKYSTFIHPTREQMDITSKKTVRDFIEKYKPDFLINFAAHRNANTAEAQRGDKKGSAWKTNVLGVRNLVELSKRYGIYLVHISTDMVFSGHSKDKGPYHEKRKPKVNAKRLSWYGWTKLLGERSVATYKDSATLRIANVTKSIYDPTLDYVGKILWLFDKKKLYPIFSDQIVTLTYIPDITKSVLSLLDKKLTGVYHVASSNLATPHQIAEYLLMKARGVSGVVTKASLDEHLKISPNRYPKFGGLNSKLTQKKLGLKFPTWQEIVDIFINSADNSVTTYAKKEPKGNSKKMG